MTSGRWQQINELFISALAHDAAERHEFLAASCGRDEELRAEVESLLAAHAEAGEFIQASALSGAIELFEEDEGESIIGQQIGAYEIIREISRGGMGVVYLAQDPRLGRKIVLKLLPIHLTADKDRLRRFKLEARAASALSHANVCVIHEVGETADGRHYIVMEYIEGETLGRRMANVQMQVGEVLDVAIQIASALTAAHSAGVVHRDIKPDNVMVRRDHIVKVLDFGLAKVSDKTAVAGGPAQTKTNEGAETLVMVQTEPGLVMGTVSYMSPEQSSGSDVDRRTDIWSVGVLLYEMLAGLVPFAGKDIYRTIIAIQEQEPQPLSHHVEGVPARLEEIVVKCLAKDKDERYQTAKDLLIDLKSLRGRLDVNAEIERTLAQELRTPGGGTSASGTQSAQPGAGVRSGQTAPTISSPEFLIGRVQQHQKSIVVAVIVLVLGVAAIAYYYHARNTEVAIESIAVLPFENQNHDVDTDYLSDGLTDSIINSLTQLPNLKVIARSSVFRYKGKQTDPIAIANELGVRAVLTGRIMQRGDGLTIGVELIDARDNKQLWGERYEKNLSDLLAVQHEVATEITSNLRLKLSGAEQERVNKHYTENPDAYQLYLKGNFYWNKRTGDAIKTAIGYFNQAIEKDPGYALAYAGLADCYVVPANPQPPTEKMPRAKGAAKRALELDESLAEAHTALARVLMTYDWEWSDAEKEFRRAIELNPRYAIAHQWYGDYLSVTGRPNEAIAEQRQALELDPLSLPINFAVGLALLNARDYDKAIQQFQKTLELDPKFPLVHAHLPEAYEQKGMYEEAIAGFQKGTALKGGTEWSFSMAGLGHVFGVAGKKAEARVVLDELLQTSRREYVPADSIALVYAGLGEKDEAFTWLEKAREEHAFKIAWLKVEPQWDSLRDDPRFADLLRRVGLQ